jgi:hypothetical protein
MEESLKPCDLPDGPLNSSDDVRQLLLRVMEAQRERARLAPPEKKSIELKRLMASMKLYHQWLVTPSTKAPPKEDNGRRGAVSEILAQLLEQPSRRKHRASPKKSLRPRRRRS